jgi:ubiquitin-activating enzyme E1-like protein 2
LQKTVLREGLSVTLWDKWELKCDEDVTFGEIYERLKKEYGLHPVGVLQGMSRVDFGKSPA